MTAAYRVVYRKYGFVDLILEWSSIAIAADKNDGLKFSPSERKANQLHTTCDRGVTLKKTFW
jgi:hypothetical protein